MHSPIRTSESIDLLSEALAAAQMEFAPVEKTRQGKIEGQSKASGNNFSFTYAYADIADVLAMALPILAKHKIATLQPTVLEGGVLTIVTRVVHAGQWMESDYPVCSLNGDHKKMGGALTYARRYALCSMLGIAPDDDIDGDGASEPAPKPQPQRHERPGPRPQRDATPFDAAPGKAKRNLPAPELGSTAWTSEVNGCNAASDLDALKRTPEFKAAYEAMTPAEKDHIKLMFDERYHAVGQANVLAAG